MYWNRLINRNPFRGKGIFSFLSIAIAVTIPLVAFALQSMFWVAIKPYVWFLFFPAVFFSSWVGGFFGGILATILSTLIVWWYFIPPTHSFAIQNPMMLVSIGIFAGMGTLFSLSHGALRRAKQNADESLSAARSANHELRGANERISLLLEKTRELDELKTQFFANVSHELRTPLTLILGPVGKLLGETGITGENRRHLKIVERNAMLLYRHVSDLLDISKLEAGRMTVRYAEIDLAAVCRMIASHFESLAGESGWMYRSPYRRSSTGRNGWWALPS